MSKIWKSLLLRLLNEMFDKKFLDFLLVGEYLILVIVYVFLFFFKNWHFLNFFYVIYTDSFLIRQCYVFSLILYLLIKILTLNFGFYYFFIPNFSIKSFCCNSTFSRYILKTILKLFFMLMPFSFVLAKISEKRCQ